MKHFKTYIFAIALLTLLTPSHSFAQTSFSTPVATVIATSITPAQELSSELSQIKATLDTGASIASFDLSPGQSMQQAASSSSTGLLSVTLPNFLHTQATSSTATTTQLAKITLQYSPCVAMGVRAGINVCTAGPTAFPPMTSELQLGQSTNYLQYNIALTKLSSSSATFAVTDSSFLSSIQDQVNAVAAKVKALLGK